MQKSEESQESCNPNPLSTPNLLSATLALANVDRQNLDHIY